jgi:hypothetical protein
MTKLVSENFEDFLNENEINEHHLDSELESEEDIDVIEDVMPEDMADTESEEEIEYFNDLDELKKYLHNELVVPEYSRTPLTCRIPGQGEMEGIPMAELSNGEAFLFKINGQIKKVKIQDILINENLNEEFSRDESFDNYLEEVTNLIKMDVPEWEDNDPDFIDWIRDSFMKGVSAEESANMVIQDY